MQSSYRYSRAPRQRTNVQSTDQQLDRVNLALASNFYGHVRKCKECKVGGPLCAECKKEWRKGKPVRVCRSEKFGKRSSKNPNGSKFAPKGWGSTAVRYDGLYKLMDYWVRSCAACVLRVWCALAMRRRYVCCVCVACLLCSITC